MIRIRTLCVNDSCSFGWMTSTSLKNLNGRGNLECRKSIIHSDLVFVSFTRNQTSNFATHKKCKRSALLIYFGKALWYFSSHFIVKTCLSIYCEYLYRVLLNWTHFWLVRCHNNTILASWRHRRMKEWESSSSNRYKTWANTIKCKNVMDAVRIFAEPRNNLHTSAQNVCLCI